MNAVIDAPDAVSLHQRLRDFVAAGSTEVTPHDEKVLDDLARILPAGFPVYVANTPKTAPDDVVRVALRLQQLGLAASPHVIARRVVDALQRGGVEPCGATPAFCCTRRPGTWTGPTAIC